ncbi:uroporphyrinogen-III synthase [Sphingosinicella sp. BN140058]|uniref:uroporphyrinogen-III synthase n=1 Tax=Sphingosinicella sp. BN140058 TaxID=1892855 RepID=UPI001011E628|nr:uroporphyrinogen-III synthase [Sphingosinicella sp. BN140058]QAY76914.1 uroporphyrinogen III synthase HEM4 [Sphingosinicella sp. BN140058]
MTRLLILRPEPGASETAERAVSMGMEPIVAPLFQVRPVAWALPEGSFDALLLTSANAARHGGPLPNLPTYTVGDATAAAAREAGAVKVVTGPSDGLAALALAAGDGCDRVLHLCGRDHVALHWPGVHLERRIVYAAETVPGLPAEAECAIAGGALILLHSPRAARRLAGLVSDKTPIRIAAISRATADAAGGGWAGLSVAAAPRDEALLELAAQLCKAGSSQMTGRDR